MLALSEPASGSVSAKEMICAPLAMPGRYLAFCATVPKRTNPWLPMPTLVPKVERKAGLVRPISNETSVSSSTDSARPPYSAGIDRPNRPSAFISSTTSAGTRSCSPTCASSGRSRSATNRRTA